MCLISRLLFGCPLQMLCDRCSFTCCTIMAFLPWILLCFGKTHCSDKVATQCYCRKNKILLHKALTFPFYPILMQSAPHTLIPSVHVNFIKALLVPCPLPHHESNCCYYFCLCHFYFLLPFPSWFYVNNVWIMEWNGFHGAEQIQVIECGTPLHLNMKVNMYIILNYLVSCN